VRIGEVIGRLTLNTCDPKFIGGRFLIVQPHDPASLREDRLGHGSVVIVYDELGADVGQRVGFSEGREGAMPFWPDHVAVDAYLACLLDDVTYGE
jgi:microcompartment protein CcmK/EutM